MTSKDHKTLRHTLVSRVAVTLGAVLLIAETACAAESTPRSASVTSNDDVPIAYEARGSGQPTLVFVHGDTGHRPLRDDGAAGRDQQSL
jgi:hypothetical protein